MKMSMIKELFYGNIGNVNEIEITEEGRQISNIAANIYNDYIKNLTEEQKKLFDNFVEAKESEIAEETAHFYVEGFKLGLLIGIECMDE